MLVQLKPVFSLLSSTLFLVAAVGLGNLLIPLRANLEGWSASTIGILGTIYAFAFTLGCIFIPRLVLRLGHVRLFGVLLALLGSSLIVTALVVDPIVWAVARSLTGFAVAGGYMIIESWLNERATNESRGTIFSVYMIVCMVALIAGQYMLPFSDPAEMTLFLVAALLFLLAALPVGLSTAQSPRPLEQVAINFKKLYANSPAAVVGGFVAGVVFGVWSSFGALYAQSVGLSNTGIATILMTATMGGLLLQYPIGKISDIVDRRFVMIGIGVAGLIICIVGMATMPGPSPLLFALYFLIGASVYPQYAVNVAHANDHAKDGNFVEISGAMLIVYGIGSMVGPLAAGLIIDGIGYIGFYIVMAIAFIIYASFSFWRILQREAPAHSERTDFQAQGINKTPTPQTYALDPRAD